MFKVKRLLTVLLTVAIIASCFTFSSSAATSLKITASVGTVEAGADTSLVLTLTELPSGNVNLIHFTFTYDSSVFTLNKISNKSVTPDSFTIPSDIEITAIASNNTIDVYLINWNKIESKGTSAFAAAQNISFSFTAKTGTGGKDYTFSVSDVEYGLDTKILQADRIAGNAVNATGKISSGVIRGDMNDDGVKSSADAVYLLRHTIRQSAYPVTQSADVNGDGKVSSADAVYLLRNTIRPDRYPLAD